MNSSKVRESVLIRISPALFFFTVYGPAPSHTARHARPGVTFVTPTFPHGPILFSAILKLPLWLPGKVVERLLDD